MQNRLIIIGGGPAAICEIATLLKSGICGNDIIWIDPEFKVGAFGSTLSQGSSVPGNTKVENYQAVNKAIYQAVPACKPKADQHFELDTLEPGFVCSLKIAAVPLQHITNELRKMVYSIEGTVTDIDTLPGGFKLHGKRTNGTPFLHFAEKVTLSIGAKSRAFSMPDQNSTVTLIDPNIAFIESELQAFLSENTNIKQVAVIGSSHSAALAAMHLLKAGVSVTQFMDKEYRFARQSVTSDGKIVTLFDNTGLKGDVAQFTKTILADEKSGKSQYQGRLTRYIGVNREQTNSLIKEHLTECSHAVACIGYEAVNTLTINGVPVSSLQHNNITMEIDGRKNLRGIGIAFPQQVKDASGEKELAVGVGKFWSTSNSRRDDLQTRQTSETSFQQTTRAKL